MSGGVSAPRRGPRDSALVLMLLIGFVTVMTVFIVRHGDDPPDWRNDPPDAVLTIGPEGVSGRTGPAWFFEYVFRRKFAGARVEMISRQPDGQVLLLHHPRVVEPVFIVEPDPSGRYARSILTHHPAVTGPGGIRVGGTLGDAPPDTLGPCGADPVVPEQIVCGELPFRAIFRLPDGDDGQAAKARAVLVEMRYLLPEP